ncbi:DNA cytosine methyltransferase [Leifsonia sp. NPDC014704]|uniref:DNA cytosine methyltransferase n=1 Tax=Leifsonia virtsii TaxID=3035915 RepID=A0ABT8J420_9MICO|nr:DNA cytosine methyltransferase [Leifsonia virtsii]MDN4599342.1 DNA cytosine methyltransferase [Leifsonia virtsii]
MENVTPIDVARPKVIEFFAGIGLARMGLESAGFRVGWSNDYESDKKAMYEAHFGSAGDHVFHLGDIGAVSADDLPHDAKLAWASSPCTDLSLAGARAGLAGKDSWSRKPLQQVHRWVGEGNHSDPADILQTAGYTGPVTALRGLGNQADKTRGSVFATAQRMSSAMVHDHLMAWATATPGQRRKAERPR